MSHSKGKDIDKREAMHVCVCGGGCWRYMGHLCTFCSISVNQTLLLKRVREIKREQSPGGGKGVSHMYTGKISCYSSYCNEVIQNFII